LKGLDWKRCFLGNLFLINISRLVLVTLFFSLIACAPQRRPIPLGEIPKPTKINPQDEQAGHEILGQLSQKYQLDYNHPRRNEVDQIVAKITSAIGASSDPWHVNVFADSSVKNAAATKGNHLFVWTGMIDTTQNEDELAGILGHEIAHVLLKHTEPTDGEAFRLVMIKLGAFAVGTAASIAVGGSGAQIAGELASNATAKVGEGLLINPYSREKELEADIVGLYLVKKAGYNPHAVIDFWRRALNDPAFSSSIPFLSTHPPAIDRLGRLETEFRRIENLPITIGRDASPQLPNLPPQKEPPTPNLPEVKVPNPSPSPFPSKETKQLPGIKVDAPLPPGDSFDVGPDIMKPKSQ
jgi:predicted Zn-dependent protease